MADYPVNLPKTNFPMKADLPKREPKMLDFWQAIDLYDKTFYMKGREQFILHDGPPYANGVIHLGHAANKIIKDIVIKSKLLSGFGAPYVPGWDCHGLPIEINVEKKLGRAGHKVTIEQFQTACRKYAEEHIASQKRDFMRLGVVGDWEHPYKTADYKFEGNIIRGLGQVVAKGYVERGYKPVHWCIACGSALAEAEVEYKDKTSPAIDVRFRVCNPEKFNVTNLSLPIWTTTPWTLPANEAVCVHPEFSYLLVSCADLNEHFILLEDLLPTILTRFGEKNAKIIKRLSGKELSGLQLQHPFLTDKIVPVILGEHVTTDAGTGAVHTAPSHGQEDFAIGRHYNLPVNNPVGSDGKFLSSAKFFAGLDVFAANDEVIKVLQQHGNLIHYETLQHSYPHCWRHKTPLIFRATQQWFISMDKKVANGKSLRDQALAAIEEIAWYPERGKDRMIDMIANRPDWCISRQRAWGTPITLFVHKTTGELHPEWQKLLAITADNVEQAGIGFWHQVNAAEFLQQHAAQYPINEYEKVTDTLDVWFDSGVTHFGVLQQRPNLSFPADLYLEGSDQYRGWFQSSLLTGLILNDTSPYRQNLSHGFTVDAHGHKMSKSLGNVIAPQTVIDRFGADILRLWIASTYMFDDFPLSDEILQRTVDAYRIFRNTARFLLGNLSGFDPSRDLVAPGEMLALDSWAVQKLLAVQEKFIADYNKYQFHLSCTNLQGLLATEISSFYFSVIKDRLYTMAPESLGRRSAQTALWHMLEILVRLMAPVLSFTAEEIWQEMRQFAMPRPETVFLSTWYDVVKAKDFAVTKISEQEWATIKTVRDVVNKAIEELRVVGKVGSSLAAEVTLYIDVELMQVLTKLGDELRFVFITSIARLAPFATANSGALSTSIAGLKLEVMPSTHKKCCRCWHYRDDVGSNNEHPELCGRCVDNLFGGGENRRFA